MTARANLEKSIMSISDRRICAKRRVSLLNKRKYLPYPTSATLSKENAVNFPNNHVWNGSTSTTNNLANEIGIKNKLLRLSLKKLSLITDPENTLRRCVLIYNAARVLKKEINAFEMGDDPLLSNDSKDVTEKTANIDTTLNPTTLEPVKEYDDFLLNISNSLITSSHDGDQTLSSAQQSEQNSHRLTQAPNKGPKLSSGESNFFETLLSNNHPTNADPTNDNVKKSSIIQDNMDTSKSSLKVTPITTLYNSYMNDLHLYNNYYYGNSISSSSSYFNYNHYVRDNTNTNNSILDNINLNYSVSKRGDDTTKLTKEQNNDNIDINQDNEKGTTCSLSSTNYTGADNNTVKIETPLSEKRVKEVDNSFKSCTNDNKQLNLEKQTLSSNTNDSLKTNQHLLNASTKNMNLNNLNYYYYSLPFWYNYAASSLNNINSTSNNINVLKEVDASNIPVSNKAKKLKSPPPPESNESSADETTMLLFEKTSFETLSKYVDNMSPQNNIGDAKDFNHSSFYFGSTQPNLSQNSLEMLKLFDTA